MNPRRILGVVILCLLAASALTAQVARQTGVVRGVVTDKGGEPVPGVTVTAAGPSMIGTVSDVTGTTGTYRLANLPAGTYTITAEIQGFKSLKQEGIIVQVGQIVTINLQTEPSSLNEQVTITASAPTVDVQSTKVGGVVTSEMIQRLPLNRTLLNVFNTVPGASGTIDTYSGSIHGGAPTTVSFEVDGVNTNDPTHNGLLQAPQFDAMEEIEITTGGLPAQVGNTGGSFVNIVTKSGGNDFSGQVQAYYTNKDLLESLFSPEQLRAMSMGKPSAPISDLDVSGALGGPIIKDRMWFFADLARHGYKYNVSFIPTVIDGKSYDQYSDLDTNYEGFFKLTTQISKKLRFFAMFAIRDRERDVYGGGGSKYAYDATFTQKKNTWISTTGNMTWILNPNTFVDFRVGYVNRWYPITAKPQYADNVNYTDRYTGYVYNGIDSWESYIQRRTYQGSARMTHFQDGLLGGDHEFGAGVEWQWGRDQYGYARKNPMDWYLYDGNVYYWRGLLGLSGPDPVRGDGLLSFVNCGPTPGGNDSINQLIDTRLSGYIQDAYTIKNRLTISLGARFDHYVGWTGAAHTTGTDSSGLAYAIGQSLESEIGFNPYGAFNLPAQKGIMNFTEISPRLGVTYDIFGTGKTALKLSVAKYTEAVPVMWFSDAGPAVMAQYQFNWFDDNENGIPDMPGTDHYVARYGNGQFARPDLAYLKSRVDPNLKTPYYWEYVASLNHELFKDFALKLQYIHKTGKNDHGWALYDKASSQYWYKYEQKPDWWVPFTTTVPAWGNYPAQDVTVYFYSLNSPWNDQFYREQLIPESKRNYNGVELTFDKRYSGGWALGGSVVYSNQKYFNIGNTGTPNDFVNGYGREYWDVPLAIKLYGSFDLPWGFVGSFFFRHTSGSPFARTVTVAAPAGWAEANNVWTGFDAYVLLEPNGTRRNQSFDNADLRFEKQVKLPFGKLAAFIDIYNLIGNSYVYYGQDPSGYWQPDGADTSVGTYTPDYNYGRITGISGTRIYKFSLRYSF